MKNIFTFLFVLLGVSCLAASPDVGLRPATSWVGTNIMSATNAAQVRDVLGLSDWTPGQAANVVADLTALALYSGGEDTVIVTDATSGGLFARSSGLAADGIIVVTNTVSNDIFVRQFNGAIAAEWYGLAAGSDNATAIANTAALNAALVYAAARIRGAVVTMKGRTTYYFDLGVVAPWNVKLDGNMVTMVFVDASGLGTFRGVRAITVGPQTVLRNINIRHKGLKTATCIGTDTNVWTTATTFERVYITQPFRIAFDMRDVTPWLSDCVVDNGSTIALRMDHANLAHVARFTAGADPDDVLTSSGIIVSAGRTNDVVTITTGVDHDLIPGQHVVTSGLTNDSSLNLSGYVFATPTDTTFTLYSPGADVSSAVESGDLAELTCGILLNKVQDGKFDTISIEGGTNWVANAVILSDPRSATWWRNWWFEECTNNFVALAGTHTIPRGNELTATVWTEYPAAKVDSGGLHRYTRENILAKAKHWYLFNEGVGTNIIDHAGNYDLTIANATSAWTNSPYGTALLLHMPKSSSHLVSAEIPSALVVDDDWTVAWCMYAPTAEANTSYPVNIFESASVNELRLYATSRSRFSLYSAFPTLAHTLTADSYMTDWEWFALSYDSDTSTLTGMTLRNDRDTEVISWKASRFFTPAYEATIKFHGRNTIGSTPWQASYAFLGLWTNTITRSDLHWLSQNLHSLRRHPPKLNQYGYTLKPPTAVLEASSGEAVLSAGAYGSKTTVYLSQGDGVTQPIELRQRSPVTAQRTSLAGATKIVDESGDAIGNFDTGWTVGASWTTNSVSAVVNATGATNSLSHTTVTPLVGPPRYVTMTLVSGGAWTVDATASLTVTVGGSLMRTFTNADPPSGTMTISGMVDGTTDEVVFTVSAPDATTVSGSFDNFKIEVLAAGDFLHRHAYEAGALVKASSATAPAPYFEFSAAGTHAANGNAKDKVIALVNTTVTSAPAILATIPSTDNNGSWRLKGKVYAAYGGGASDYDNFMLELDYVDGSGTYTTSLHSTDLTGDVFAWNAAGYFLIGANADTADGDVTINTSSVEYKP